MPVPTRRRSVLTATAPRNMRGSLMLPGMKWCCPIVPVSNPNSSATRASAKVGQYGSGWPGSMICGKE